MTEQEAQNRTNGQALADTQAFARGVSELIEKHRPIKYLACSVGVRILMQAYLQYHDKDSRTVVSYETIGDFLTKIVERDPALLADVGHPAFETIEVRYPAEVLQERRVLTETMRKKILDAANAGPLVQ